MAEQLVHRPARRHYPPVPPEPETLAAPPVEHDVSALARALGGVGRAARTERRERRRYLDYIRARGKELASRHAETRAAALRSQPDPHHLGEVIRDPERLWERRRTDPWLRLLAQARARLATLGVDVPAHAAPRQMAELLARRPDADAHAGLRDWLLRLEAWRYARAPAPAGLAALRREFRQLRRVPPGHG